MVGVNKSIKQKKAGPGDDPGSAFCAIDTENIGILTEIWYFSAKWAKKIRTHILSKYESLCGGAEGNRTPVRKQLGKNFSGRSLLFTFPHPGGNKHPTGISSFMMHGMGKAYHTHGLHSNHTRARLVDLPGRMGA